MKVLGKRVNKRSGNYANKQFFTKRFCEILAHSNADVSY
jgi:hypothetical protein